MLVFNIVKRRHKGHTSLLLTLVCRKFDIALDVGCGRGHIARHMLEDSVGVLHQCDVAEKVLVSEIDSGLNTHVTLIVDTFQSYLWYGTWWSVIRCIQRNVFFSSVVADFPAIVWVSFSCCLIWIKCARAFAGLYYILWGSACINVWNASNSFGLPVMAHESCWHLAAL